MERNPYYDVIPKELIAKMMEVPPEPPPAKIAEPERQIEYLNMLFKVHKQAHEDEVKALENIIDTLNMRLKLEEHRANTPIRKLIKKLIRMRYCEHCGDD